ncbi:meiosis initiator protein isoform X2 [Gopherus flavomarginatus]|uniref:meiosis initiator protein isoform X2 n=1 Tax=Gopherus flavomarginatus TaxID=286002 RepID=UPI0021CC40A7|nr:meiosis initiator protein isoform X2 [Gopherus flavomarginatus]
MTYPPLLHPCLIPPSVQWGGGMTRGLPVSPSHSWSGSVWNSPSFSLCSPLQMWGQVGRAGPWEPCPDRSSCQLGTIRDGKRRGNYTNTLRELAQMLPVPLHTSYKKLTKKEILLRVLRYIEHLQASISTARSLLRCGEKEEFGAGASRCAEMSACQRGCGDGTPPTTPRRRRAKLLNVGKKPRKGKRTRRSEWRGANKETRRSLSLVESPWQPGQRTEADLHAAGKGAVLSLGTKQLPFQFSRKDLVLGSRRPTGSAFLERAEGGVPSCAADWCVGCDREGSQEEDDVCSTCEAQLSYRDQRRYDGPDLALLGQELVQYYSCEEEEEDALDAGPWLSTQSPVCSSHESLLLCSPGSRGQIGACWASKDLGLSPSLFSSPGRLLPGHVLQGGPEELSQGLFEEVCLSPDSAGSSDSLAGTLLRKSAFSLDHCYLSYSEASNTDSSPSSGVTEFMGVWSGQLLQEGSSPGPARSVSSSEENSDSTWIPYKRTNPLPAAGRKRKKGEGGRQLKASSKSRSPLQLKKKCVNGFIMFCRLNRKQYIRACPGMASTAATRELAQLWRTMTKQERRPYCIKARRFSRLNNRIVKQDFSSGGEEEEEMEAPKPFHLLLAEKSLGSRDLGPLVLPRSLQHPVLESV